MCIYIYIYICNFFTVINLFICIIIIKYTMLYILKSFLYDSMYILL